MRKGKSNKLIKENNVMYWMKDNSWEILLVVSGYAIACIIDLLQSLAN